MVVVAVNISAVQIRPAPVVMGALRSLMGNVVVVRHKDEFVLPMLPPGGSIDDIITDVGGKNDAK